MLGGQDNEQPIQVSPLERHIGLPPVLTPICSHGRSSRRTIPILAIFSMGGMYVFLKQRTIMMKRRQSATDGADYAVATNRSGDGYRCLPVCLQHANDLIGGGV